MSIRVFTAFSGYDSQLLALKRLKQDFPSFDYECVGWSEIDKYAIQAHNALFPELADKNYGDICNIDWEKVPDFDLLNERARKIWLGHRPLEEGASDVHWTQPPSIPESHSFRGGSMSTDLLGEKNKVTI